MEVTDNGEIHVLHVLNSAHGGSSISTLELIAELRNRGIRSSLICFNNADRVQRQLISSFVDDRVLFIPLYWMNKRIRVKWWKRPLLELLNTWKTWRGHRFQGEISKFIRKHGVNLIHTSTSLNPEGAIAARGNKIPHVWHVRELIGPGSYFQFYNHIDWAKYVLQGCEQIVANSRITQQYLERFFPGNKIICIPNGIDVSGFSVKEHKSSATQVVAMIGSVTARLKNHSFFISVASLFSLRSDVEFRIYGSLPHPDDGYYSALRAMPGSKHVRFMDFAQSPAQVMKEIDVLFHPAALESFGRIYIEAFAGGIPVVAPDQGGALEMVRDGENGFLFRTGDIQHAKEKIDQLLGSAQLRNEMGKKGRDLVESQYTVARLGEKMSDLYKIILKRSSLES